MIQQLLELFLINLINEKKFVLGKKILILDYPQIFTDKKLLNYNDISFFFSKSPNNDFYTGGLRPSTLGSFNFNFNLDPNNLQIELINCNWEILAQILNVAAN